MTFYIVDVLTSSLVFGSVIKLGIWFVSDILERYEANRVSFEAVEGELTIVLLAFVAMAAAAAFLGHFLLVTAKDWWTRVRQLAR